MYPQLICPETHERLVRKGDAFCTPDDRRMYDIRDEIPDCVFPRTLLPDDARSRAFYDRFAPVYRRLEKLGARFLVGFDIEAAWADLAARVPAGDGESILEVSPGPGIHQAALAAKVGPHGRLTVADLSRPMLIQCRSMTREQQPRPVLVQANAAHLPFEDGTFDGLFHFGGVNLFGEPDRALAEFARVVRRGGWVAYGDEAFSQSWQVRDDWRKRWLRKMNPGYDRQAPAHPAGMVLNNETIVMGGLGYLRVCIRS